MKTVHFYGDSWTLEYDPEKLIKDCVGYPSTIGKLLDVPVINHGVGGNSQMSMVDQFIRSNINPGDHAVFSLTSPSRRFYFNDNGQGINTTVDKNKESINDYQDSWVSALTCYSLINLCHLKQCQPWFVNLFNVSYQQEWAHPLWNLIPQEVWLLPPNRCLVQDVFDPEWFSQFEIFRNSDFYDWLNTNNQAVNNYIRPCSHHPNLRGKNAIAEFLANKLKDKI